MSEESSEVKEERPPLHQRQMRPKKLAFPMKDVEPALREVFQLIDRDASGFVTVDEYVTLRERMHAVDFPFDKCDRVTAAEQVRKDMRLADENADGKISFQELVHSYRRRWEARAAQGIATDVHTVLREIALSCRFLKHTRGKSLVE